MAYQNPSYEGSRQDERIRWRRRLEDCQRRRRGSRAGPAVIAQGTSSNKIGLWRVCGASGMGEPPFLDGPRD